MEDLEFDTETVSATPHEHFLHFTVFPYLSAIIGVYNRKGLQLLF
jgi:hypothetical protein